MKIRRVGAELFHADRRTDGRTDTKKQIVKIVTFGVRKRLITLSILTRTKHKIFHFEFLTSKLGRQHRV